jgi:hypothetical protein
MAPMNRRGFLTGLVSAFAAPAIVRFESIMPVRAPKLIVPFGGVSVAQIRAELLPGLFDVHYSYAHGMIPRQWDRIFKEHA